MLLPSIFGDNLFDEFVDDMFPANTRKTYRQLPSIMRTDIRETDDSYVLDVELPGFKKEDVKLQLKDGYLNITASTQSTDEEKDDQGKFLRRERYTGAMERSFYVGEDLTEEDVKARFEKGVLTLTLPKEQPKKIEEPKFIAIE
ncbi:MAG: Hsp20/alpha crystallin family protein [Anaerovoracaceae bacterium]|jgi:HSP20 family molecular chaperone IbpA|nr:Hsp20/alpha crystallin family protein [Bacillota bacterium]MEE3382602.1 Hsp20/alpha crystallin family protein [Anaerovoracaceae bacterium]